MATVPLVNGNRYDFASIELRIRGQIFTGFKEISYSHKLEPGEVRGSAAQPIARTRGEYSAEGSLTLYRQEYDELVAVLGDGFMETEFEGTVTHAERGQPTITDRLVGVRIKSDDSSYSQGADALEVKLDLSIMYLLKNGKSPLLNLRR